VGHMTEKVVIPPAEQIEIYRRRHTHLGSADHQPFRPEEDLVPAIAHAGEGYRFHVPGLTHDERGYPSMTVAAQDRLVRRLQEKIHRAADELVFCDEEGLDDAEVVVVSYGITSRVAQRAIDLARERGVRVGKLRLLIVWPFPDGRIRELASRVKAFVVPELNLGQMVREVERAAAGQAPAIPVSHAGGGVHRPEAILEAILEAAR